MTTTPHTPPPAAAVFDVNETLSDMRGLAAYLEEVGAGPELLPPWFAATLRDGFALTAARARADFASIAVSTLADMLRDAPTYEAVPSRRPSTSSGRWPTSICTPMWRRACRFS